MYTPRKKLIFHNLISFLKSTIVQLKMNKRTSMINSGSYQSVGLQEWMRLYTSAPVQQVLLPTDRCLHFENLIQGNLAVRNFPDERSILTSMPFGVPNDFSNHAEAHRYRHAGMKLLEKVAQKRNPAADNINTIYAYIILLASTVRNIVFSCETMDQIEEFAGVLVEFRRVIQLWIAQTDAELVQGLLNRIAYDGTGPDNIERTIAWNLLGRRPCLQQVAQQMFISFKRTLKHEPIASLTANRIAKLCYANFCINRFQDSPEQIVESINQDIGVDLLAQEDSQKPVFILKLLTDYDVTPEQIDSLVQRAQMDSNTLPDWCVEAPEGIKILNLWLKEERNPFNRIQIDPPVIQPEHLPDVEGIACTAHPSAVGGIEQWTALQLDSGVFSVVATPHYKCRISEGNPNNDGVPEACFRVVIDGSPYVMGKGYSSSGMSNVNGRFVHTRLGFERERLVFDKPFILDLNNKTLTQNNFSVRLQSPVVLGFKNCFLSLTPIAEQIVEPGSQEHARQALDAPVAVRRSPFAGW